MATKSKAAKKTTTKKAAPKKAAPKKKTTTVKKAAPASKSKPAGPREHKAAESALKLVDQAASLLREGIRNSADTTEKARLQAKQKAHGLLTKATLSLSDLLEGSSSALHKVIGKL